MRILSRRNYIRGLTNCVNVILKVGHAVGASESKWITISKMCSASIQIYNDLFLRKAPLVTNVFQITFEYLSCSRWFFPSIANSDKINLKVNR